MSGAQNKNYNEMSDSEKKKEDWMNSKWRPMMGWMYMLTCTMDFVIFPILWSIVQVIAGGEVKSQWSPITLQGAGLFHMAMGAVLGLAAWGRTQEKMAGANNGGLYTDTPSTTSFSTPKTNTLTVTSFSTQTGDTHSSFNPTYTPSGPYKPCSDPRTLQVVEDDHDDEPDLTRAK